MNLLRRSLLADCLLVVIPVTAILLSGWLVGDERLATLLTNTILLAIGTAVLALPLGTILALLLVKTDVPGRRLALLALVVMLFLPVYLQAAGWKAAFDLFTWNPVAGTNIRRPVMDGWSAAIWIHAAAAIPWVVLVVGTGLWYVEPDLEEEALLHGSPLQVFLHVTLIRTATAIGAAALLVLILTSGEIAVTDLYRIDTFAEEYYSTGGSGSDIRRRAGLVTGVVLGSLACLAVVVISRAAPVRVNAQDRNRLVIRASWGRWLSLAFLSGCLLLWMGVPLVHLISRSAIQVREVDGEFIRSWSVWKVASMVGMAPLNFAEEFGWTLLIGTASAICSLMIALPLAWSARAGGWRSVPAVIVCAVCLSVPGPILGLGLIWLLNWEQSPLMIWLYDRTIMAPVLATTIRALPVTFFILWYGLRSVTAEQLDSAATDGAGAVVRFWRIAVAQRVMLVVISWILTLAVTTGDLSASILVVPPGVDTISRRVFGLMHAGVTDQVAGICLANAAQICLLVLAASFLHRRWMSKPDRDITAQ